mmetsp:Transcript_10604/g.15607  ORF Transcript_10604/g.15607 Transcript_10604/m.15607 type:complete len:262 (+) Transcript_10604:183-968(+)
MRLSAELLNSAEQRPNALGERELVLRGRGVPLIEHLGATRDAFDTFDFTDNRLTHLDNFPRLNRLTNLLLSGNWIETVSVENLSKNLPNVTSLTLSFNRISSLHEVTNLGKSFPKLEFLTLVGNPVTRRQHYRLYVIHHIPTLRVLDMQRISRSERDKAQRLARSAAGAAMESDVQLEKQQEQKSKTFTPGEEKPIFTKEQKQQLRDMVAAAKTPQEIEEIESMAQKGIFPSHLLDNNKRRAAEDTTVPNGNGNTKKLRAN